MDAQDDHMGRSLPEGQDHRQDNKQQESVVCEAEGDRDQGDRGGSEVPFSFILSHLYKA